MLSSRQARLTKAALETLAIVAYKQPVTRHQVSAIRGVNSDGVLRALADRGLVEEAGREEGPGRPVLYGTTPTFLERLGLPSLAVAAVARPAARRRRCRGGRGRAGAAPRRRRDARRHVDAAEPDEPPSSSVPPERLQRLLARAGYGSRRACEELIVDGRVTVNGRVATLGDKVGSRSRIEVRGRRSRPSTSTRT